MMRFILTAFCVMGLFSNLFGGEKPAEKPKGSPPVPARQPDIEVPLEKVIDRFRYYTDNKKDFVVFKHGTCVLVSDGLEEEQARKEALETVAKIFNHHPDMNPRSMDDGNILICCNHPAYTLVLEEITRNHMDMIRTNHLRALAWDEVLITPAGQNKFDDLGMKALFGRCYFFMDAKKPEVFGVIRKTISRFAAPPGVNGENGTAVQ
jgi:hypothetical protein